MLPSMMVWHGDKFIGYIPKEAKAETPVSVRKGALYTAHPMPTASGPSYTAGRRIPDNKHIHRHQKGGGGEQWGGANGGK